MWYVRLAQFDQSLGCLSADSLEDTTRVHIGLKVLWPGRYYQGSHRLESTLVRDDDAVSADTFCAMLGVQEVTAALRTRRLRWNGHVAGSSSCINSITSMTIPSARRRGRPKKIWS